MSSAFRIALNQSSSISHKCSIMKTLLAFATLLFLLSLVQATTLYNNDIDGFGLARPYAETSRRRCPLCDSSVFSYCSDKLFHDSCCCHNPNNPYDRLPYQCQFADCSFLHANTCQEHKLITACCCTNIYFKK